MFDHTRHEVISEGDFIAVGTKVKVLRIQGNYLVVTKIDEAS